jgi:hypothetical protein
MGTRKPVKKPKASTHRSYRYRPSNRYTGDKEAVYNALSDDLATGDKRRKPYKKAFGSKDKGDPCHFEITKKNYEITAYPFEKNWRPWLKNQLTKHGVPQREASKLANNLSRDITESHFVLGDVKIPPYLVGQKFTDRISGIIVKYGDESHPDNLEIEVDHEIKRRIDSLEENQKQMMANLSKLLKESEKEDRKFKSKLTIMFGLLTQKEYDTAMKKGKDNLRSSIKDGWYKTIGPRYRITPHVFDQDRKIRHGRLEEFLGYEEWLTKIAQLAKKGKILRIK